ncbi:ParB-like nuclease domain-containing protein [Escherichia coli]|nr:ParB-like nuclease domain-containing protein [Escherichia coli]
METDLILQKIREEIKTCLRSIESVELKTEIINELRMVIHDESPFKNEPVDCVLWVPASKVTANNYNPNVMAPVEKKLLERSINKDGYTQPVVVAKFDENYLVVDGYHRHLVGKSSSALQKRLHGYLPVTKVAASRHGQKDRIAATIRHNRARGKHQVIAMSEIVRDLFRLGWNDKQIGKELGMDSDEVLRLKQISGLTELFEDEQYSQAWTIE